MRNLASQHERELEVARVRATHDAQQQQFGAEIQIQGVARRAEQQRLADDAKTEQLVDRMKFEMLEMQTRLQQQSALEA